jgi:hypothetical protein
VRAALAGWRPLEMSALRKGSFRTRIILCPVLMRRAYTAIGAGLCRRGIRLFVLGADRCATVRGMEELEVVLRMRLSRGPPSEAQINAVAAAIGAAATGAERT